jgi:hypothetical protein
VEAVPRLHQQLFEDYHRTTAAAVPLPTTQSASENATLENSEQVSEDNGFHEFSYLWEPDISELDRNDVHGDDLHP